jgi:superfamily I DNA/RNA helicase
VLCRTNAEAMAQAMSAMQDGHDTAIVGGGREIRALAEAAVTLKAGAGTSHPELYAFQTWGEVQDHAENDPGGSDLRVLVKLIDDHGPDVIMQMVDRLCDERRAHTVISTAHKAKGREWNSVKIATDFREPKRDPENPDEIPEVPAAEAMLAYVSVTRARLTLDRSGLAWVDSYLPAAG